MTPRLIGIDWGTSSFRAWLMGDGGAVLDEVPSGPGILAVSSGGFEAALDAVVGPWLSFDVPIIASGMITSRNGWVETPYLPLPCGIADLAGALVLHRTAGRGLHFVTGVMRSTDATLPDVMRGEETEIAGHLAASGASEGLFVLPGTHSKWARVEGGRLVAFQTVMTGEVYALLLDHSILGRLAEDGVPDDDAFRRGLAVGRQGGALLGRAFSARSLVLMGRLAPGAVRDYLSGLLIGDEVAAGLAEHGTTPVTIIGRGDLAERYRIALSDAGADARVAPPGMARAGHWAIAEQAGLLT